MGNYTGETGGKGSSQLFVKNDKGFTYEKFIPVTIKVYIMHT